MMKLTKITQIQANALQFTERIGFSPLQVNLCKSRSNQTLTKKTKPVETSLKMTFFANNASIYLELSDLETGNR